MTVTGPVRASQPAAPTQGQAGTGSHDCPVTPAAPASQALTIWLPLTAIAMLALCLDLFFFEGFVATPDENGYLLAAYRLSNGLPLSDPLDAAMTKMHVLRLGFVGPVALACWLAQGKIFYAAALQVFYHLGLLLLGYDLGSTLKNRRTGLLTAFLVAVCPLFYLLATVIRPDLSMCFWWTFCLVLLLRGLKHLEYTVAGRGFGFLLLVGAGFCLGLAYMSGPVVLLTLAPLAATLVWFNPAGPGRRFLPALLAFISGLAALLLLEQVLFLWLSGHVSWPLAAGAKQGGRMATLSLDQLTARASRLFEHLPQVLPVSFWGWLAGLAGGVLLWPGEGVRLRLALVLVTAWSILYLCFGSTSLTQYRPLPIDFRYFILVAPPACCLLAWSAVTLAERWERGQHRPWGGTAGLLALGLLPALLFLGDLAPNLPRAGEAHKRSRLVGSFMEAAQLAREMRPGYPLVLSGYLSDRMLGVFLWDHGPLVLRNNSFHQFRHPLPPPPFLFLEEKETLHQRGEPLDFSVPPDWGKVEVRQLKVVSAPAARLDRLQQGNWPAVLNPLATEGSRRSNRETVILVVERSQREEPPCPPMP